MQLRCRENEQQMLRRLLDDLQQRVEGRNGEHMHLVDDIHPHFHLRRRINGVVPQVADVVYAVVGRGVDLQHVHAGAGIDGLAGFADVAGVTVVGIQAVDRLRQNLSAAGLARAPGAGEQIRMADTVMLNLICQSSHYVILTFDIREIIRSELSVKSSVTHE